MNLIAPVLTKTIALLAFIAFACGIGVAEQREPGDLFVILDDAGRYGFIDETGKVVIKPQFLWADGFENGYAEVYACGRSAYVDKAGHVFSFDPGSRELRPRKVGKKYGFATASGQLRIPALYDEARSFSDGLAAVREGGKWGFIDESGKYALPPTFMDAYFFWDGLGSVKLESDQDVWIDKHGKIVVKGYDIAQVPSEGRLGASQNGRYGYLDYQGNLVIPLLYDTAREFREGLAPVMKNKKWGFVDYRGNVAIPLEYDSVDNFHQGLAAAKKDGRSGFIDKGGKFVFFLDFDEAFGFAGGLSTFRTEDRKFGYVNQQGKVVWGPAKHAPSHWPLLGWSDEEKAASCEGVSRAIREQVRRFPIPPKE